MSYICRRSVAKAGPAGAHRGGTSCITANIGTSRNAQSFVLTIEYQDFAAVFTGDAD
jgi:hypothetical protein